MKRIIRAFEKGKSYRKMLGVEYDDGTTGEAFGYYPDEKYFTFNEFVGLTIYEARELYLTRSHEHKESKKS